MDENNVSSAKSKKNLQYGFTAQEVVNFIDSLQIVPSTNIDLDNLTTVNVSLAQILVRSYNSLEDYIREMNMIVKDAVNQHAHIVCFPAFAGLLPASLFPQYERIINGYKRDNITNNPSDMWIYQAFVGLASECFEVFFSTMSSLASSYKIYIAAGSSVYPNKGQFTHRAMLFAPNGALAGFQDKLSPGLIENTLQIDPGGKLKVFDTPIAKFAMIIGDDIDYFETARVAYAQGAHIIINPSAHIAPFDNSKAAQGLNLRVQENPVFGIQPTLIGSMGLDFRLEGNSGVYGPEKFSSPSAKNCRYLSTMKDYQTQVITARLSLDELEAITVVRNPELVRKYIDYIY